MNVLESRPGRPLRLRPWVLVLGAAVIVAAALYLATGSSPSTHPGSATGSQGSSHSGPSRTPANEFFLKATNPAPGAQNVPPNTTISVTFSAPVSLRKATPHLSPAIGGKWVQTSASTLSYDLETPLIPSTREVLTIPGGSAGVHATDGAILAASHTVTFDVAAGDTLRLQQLLAGLDFLPVGFTATGPPPSRADLAQDQAGTFSWRWPGLPSELTSQWTQGTENMITKAAIEAFETQNGLGVDGIAGPAVWTSLINDTINNKTSATPYVYVLVNKTVPQNLTLWNNGVAQLGRASPSTRVPRVPTRSTAPTPSSSTCGSPR